MSLWHVVVLAVVQGLAELLPVSSSAHVVVAEKLMGMDPSSPEMTLLLVTLDMHHVCRDATFGSKEADHFQTAEAFKTFAILLIIATALTGVIGEGIVKLIEHFGFPNPARGGRTALQPSRIDRPRAGRCGCSHHHRGNLREASSSGEIAQRRPRHAAGIAHRDRPGPLPAFSRLFALRRHDSTGLLAGVSKQRAETFSFALAVVLTPAVDAREL